MLLFKQYVKCSLILNLSFKLIVKVIRDLEIKHYIVSFFELAKYANSRKDRIYIYIYSQSKKNYL